jgi:hypothetical protein
MRDAVVERALKDLIEPLFEPDFHPRSFGYRPKRSIAQVAVEIQSTIDAGHLAFHRADIEDCFLNIDIEKLLSMVGQRVLDSRLLALLEKILRHHKAGLWSRGTNWRKTKGILLGSPLSPLLCNIYLSPLDYMLDRRQAQFFRWADDLLILDPDIMRLKETTDLIDQFLETQYPGDFRLNWLKFNYGFAVDDQALWLHWGPLHGHSPAIAGNKIAEIAALLARNKFSSKRYQGVRSTYLSLPFTETKLAIERMDEILIEVATALSGSRPKSIEDTLSVCANHSSRAALPFLEACRELLLLPYQSGAGEETTWVPRRLQA